MGSCQQAAKDEAPCTYEMGYGSGRCDSQTFTNMFEERVAEGCQAWAVTLTGVDPASGQWGQQQEQQQEEQQEEQQEVPPAPEDWQQQGPQQPWQRKTRQRGAVDEQPYRKLLRLRGHN